MENATHETSGFAHFESFRALKAIHLLKDEERTKILHARLNSQLLSEFMSLADLDVTTICFVLGLSGHEYRDTCRHEAFTADQSERIMTLATLYAHGYYIYGNRESFNYWMKSHASFLGRIPPLSIVNSLLGVKDMLSKLKALEHGVIL